MKLEELRAKLAKVEDPRRTDRGNIRHKLEDIIIIGLSTLICDGEDFEDMEEFGKQRRECLRSFWNCPMGFQTVTHSDVYLNV